MKTVNRLERGIFCIAQSLLPVFYGAQCLVLGERHLGVLQPGRPRAYVFGIDTQSVTATAQK